MGVFGIGQTLVRVYYVVRPELFKLRNRSLRNMFAQCLPAFAWACAPCALEFLLALAEHASAAPFYWKIGTLVLWLCARAFAGRPHFVLLHTHDDPMRPGGKRGL